MTYGVVGEDGVDLVDLGHGGLGSHVVDLEAGHIHWDTGMRSVPDYMEEDVVLGLHGRVYIFAKSTCMK